MIYYSYNVATEIYKPGRTDFPALIPQNGAMAELLLSRLCGFDKLTQTNHNSYLEKQT